MPKKQFVITFSCRLKRKEKNVLTFNFRLSTLLFYSSQPIFVNIMQTLLMINFQKNVLVNVYYIKIMNLLLPVIT